VVDAVYAHSLQSGMASVAERVTALAFGEAPRLRVIDGKQRDVRQPLDEGSATEPISTQLVDLLAPPTGIAFSV
jgi:hypothetical protein